MMVAGVIFYILAAAGLAWGLEELPAPRFWAAVISIWVMMMIILLGGPL